MKQVKRILCLMLLACLAAGSACAADSLPYDCYNYDHWNNILYTPAPYVPDGLVSGATLRLEGEPVGAFRNPQGIDIDRKVVSHLCAIVNLSSVQHKQSVLSL